jgi:hypothetical protein
MAESSSALFVSRGQEIITCCSGGEATVVEIRYAPVAVAPAPRHYR